MSLDATIVHVEKKTFNNICALFDAHGVSKAIAGLLECEFDRYGYEIADWKKKFRRELVGHDERYHLDAALERSPEILNAIQDKDTATAIYNGLCNNLWYRRDPVRVAWVTTWRKASALVALLRDNDEDEGTYYGTQGEGHLSLEVERLIRRTGWIAMDEAVVRVELEFATQRLAELLALPKSGRDPREEVYLRYLIDFGDLKAADKRHYLRQRALDNVCRILTQARKKE